MTTSTLGFDKPYTIKVQHTIYGWKAQFSNLEDRFGGNKWLPTNFTRHAKGADVERALRAVNPNATIYVIGG